MEYKTLGSILTTEDYNAYVSLLKYNTTLSERFTISNSLVNGVYADYEFGFENATIIDNGLLITNESKSSVNTIGLVNPIFKNSDYILTFKIMSIDDYNVFNETTYNIHYTNMELTLTNDDNIVELDLTSYENNLVILFDVEVLIKHNVEFKEIV